ncbi:GNAT family N-acetyltransferase [Bradyrhizobium sp. WSM4349]|uniref:GNAT family N-acetyltransferase n=1 Tax=Bradyrhizobium sp. WSM4349 TaxID=1040988 RepID=UPI0012F7F4E7
MGFDQAFLEACRRELSLSRRDLEETQVAVAEENGEIVGVVQVKVSSGEAELLKLFIEPHALRSGTGRILFAWAAEVSRDEGATQWLLRPIPTRHRSIVDWEHVPPGRFRRAPYLADCCPGLRSISSHILARWAPFASYCALNRSEPSQHAATTCS